MPSPGCGILKQPESSQPRHFATCQTRSRLLESRPASSSTTTLSRIPMQTLLDPGIWEVWANVGGGEKTLEEIRGLALRLVDLGLFRRYPVGC